MAGYAYTIKPIYVSTAKLIVGHYSDENLLNSNQIRSELTFFYNHDFTLEDIIGKFYLVQSISHIGNLQW